MTDEHHADVLPEVAALQSMDCIAERHPTLPLLAISVPTSADITQVYDRLEAGAVSGQWDYEVGLDFVAHWIDSANSGLRPTCPE